MMMKSTQTAVCLVAALLLSLTVSTTTASESVVVEPDMEVEEVEEVDPSPVGFEFVLDGAGGVVSATVLDANDPDYVADAEEDDSPEVRRMLSEDDIRMLTAPPQDEPDFNECFEICVDSFKYYDVVKILPWWKWVGFGTVKVFLPVEAVNQNIVFVARSELGIGDRRLTGGGDWFLKVPTPCAGNPDPVEILGEVIFKLKIKLGLVIIKKRWYLRWGVVNTCGDPHFTTWHGEKYDFHGACDLDLVSDPDFNEGTGLAVQVRTEIVRQWSYIKAAAIKIGDDILEVSGGANKQDYWLNSKYHGELTTIGGCPVTYKKVNTKSHSYLIHLQDKHDSAIEIRTYKDMVRVDFKNGPQDVYGNSVGLLGDFNTGNKLGRDGVTDFGDDYVEFGMEWQVLPGESLFRAAEGPQLPEQQCVMPSELSAEDHRRRLGQRTVSNLEATIACHASGVSEGEHESCVADVLGADDLSMVEIYLNDSNGAGSH